MIGNEDPNRIEEIQQYVKFAVKSEAFPQNTWKMLKTTDVHSNFRVSGFFYFKKKKSITYSRSYCSFGTFEIFKI